MDNKTTTKKRKNKSNKTVTKQQTQQSNNDDRHYKIKQKERKKKNKWCLFQDVNLIIFCQKLSKLLTLTTKLKGIERQQQNQRSLIQYLFK